MPVLFVGHGSPMNAIEDNRWSRGFADIAKLVPRPAAILSISAHWFVPGTMTTENEKPKTIHDFGGFPKALYNIQYPAPGKPALAEKVAGMLMKYRASKSSEWGLDHGTWSVLRRMYSQADVPVIQLSIDQRKKPEEHLAIGKALASLRDEGVLIMGSGNIVHNLGYAMQAMADDELATPDWSFSFDAKVAEAVSGHAADTLVSLPGTKEGKLAHPTLDHYLPLLYPMGASEKGDKVSFPVSGFDLGSLSMRAVLWG